MTLQRVGTDFYVSTSTLGVCVLACVFIHALCLGVTHTVRFSNASLSQSSLALGN